jgi:hypothetical protein
VGEHAITIALSRTFVVVWQEMESPNKKRIQLAGYKWLLVDFFSFGPTNAGDNDHFIIHNKLVQSRD